MPYKALSLLFLVVPCLAQQPALLDILQQELTRNYAVLKDKGDPPAYYLSYSVTEQESVTASAVMGVLQNRANSHNRLLDVTLRLGSPKLDNYHPSRGGRPQFTSGTAISLDNNRDAIVTRLWSETDRIYRASAQYLNNVKTNTQVNLADEDDSGDFSPADSVVFQQTPKPLSVSADEWSGRVKRWSAEFNKYPGVLGSGVSVSVQRDVHYMVSSEGTRLQHGRTFARISILAQGKSLDGMDLSTGETIDAAEPDRLPKDDVVAAAVKRVATQLTALLQAPEVEPYVGPAILSNRSAGVFFHEIFGHRIEGHRQKESTEGQTFTKSVGTKVLPEFLSVSSDPTRKSIEGVDLNGYYDFDDEGVKARPVTVVDDGVLKTFLLSRSPIKGFPVSNGHGRRQPGLEVVSRQSNLIVESKKKVSDQQLREMLIAEVKRQGKPYGLLFDQVTGGYTTTGRRGLQAFKVLPVLVYRVYPDGRPDELVRGADIVGTPLASFAKIMATSNELGVFNGYCGAESGSVPVSAVAPALLVSELEIQKREKGQDRPPLLPRPDKATVGGAQ